MFILMYINNFNKYFRFLSHNSMLLFLMNNNRDKKNKSQMLNQALLSRNLNQKDLNFIKQFHFKYKEGILNPRYCKPIEYQISQSRYNLMVSVATTVY